MPVPTSRIRTGLWADNQRHLLRAYEYLCHVGEAQQWIEGCLGEELGFGVVEMEEGLRNGVVLAKLVRVFQGEGVVKRIYEVGAFGKWWRYCADWPAFEGAKTGFQAL
jgi:Ras GTPase-activating-like protein IQGAP2/3